MSFHEGTNPMKIVLTLGLSLALSAPVSAFGGGEDDAPPNGRIVATTLSSIRRSPDAYKGVWVSFPIQFVSIGRISNAFFTQFTPNKYANFYGWASEQPIWRKEEYDNLFGLMFMSKTNDRLDELYGVKLYQQLQVTGVVRNVFQGEPWIEVTEFSKLAPKVNTGVLSHLYRGEQFMKKRQWTKALSELSLAPAANVPDNVLVTVHKDMAICYLRQGEAESAVRHINSALAMMDDPDPETQRLASIAMKRPEMELDRSVHHQIADHERPMWEAFEDQNGQGTPTPPKRR